MCAPLLIQGKWSYLLELIHKIELELKEYWESVFDSQQEKRGRQSHLPQRGWHLDICESSNLAQTQPHLSPLQYAQWLSLDWPTQAVRS